MDPITWQTVLMMAVTSAVTWAATRVKSNAPVLVDPQNKMPVVDALRDLARQGLLMWNGSPLSILPAQPVTPTPAAPAADSNALLDLIHKLIDHRLGSAPAVPASPPAPPDA